MSEARPLTILCITSYEKGQEFLRACKDQGCRVLLLTVEKFRDGDWPRESIDETFYMPPDLPTWAIVNTVSYMARWQPIDRIVALDEFDMENAAALREHLRIPGMGLTTVRHFRDKLAAASEHVARLAHYGKAKRTAIAREAAEAHGSPAGGATATSG